MGIWVKCHGNTLICCTAIGTTNDNKIWASGVNGKEDYILGKYNSEAEADIVIEDLENHIEAIEYYKNKSRMPGHDMPCPPAVFTMPPSGFSESEAK